MKNENISKGVMQYDMVGEREDFGKAKVEVL
jgi:hypothetical protein